MTTLRFTESNPAPDIAADGHVETPDGFSVRYARFRADANPVKGTVVILQGRNEFIEKYFETISDILDAGFDVVAFDWRGQGGSQRFFRRIDSGYVDSFEQYAIDLDTVFEQIVLPDCRPPYFILGHSSGALAALYTAPAYVNRIRRMVLSSPFLGLPASDFKHGATRAVTKMMGFLGLGNLYVYGGSAARLRKPFEINPLTSDSDRYARNTSVLAEHPELAIGGPSASWVSAAFRAIDVVSDPEHMARTTTPTLVLMAGAESVVSNAAIETLTTRLRSASLLTIDGARHELMQEADIYREQFMAALLAFIPGSGAEPGLPAAGSSD
ncbi:alpha/beta fold hydrolase [Oricola thermophila]|uniref:Alpha/beta hydrolase n=1 Tax=Oricola thermophila TaxID=2742145 RepID=A0A6N1VHR9_9HYPH|nr:alpha/beta hydrolase [Oricola thermophila]QKV20358.1 alpha/beta hydrolase [Oricola thermophila]